MCAYRFPYARKKFRPDLSDDKWGRSKEIRVFARNLYLQYQSFQAIASAVNKEFPNAKFRAKDIGRWCGVFRWSHLRTKLEQKQMEKFRSSGYQTAVNIASSTAQLLSRGLSQAVEDGFTPNIGEMGELSKIFERFDKVMRLEQKLPTDIVANSLSQNELINLINSVDYLEMTPINVTPKQLPEGPDGKIDLELAKNLDEEPT